jgi:hypothetical protein
VGIGDFGQRVARPQREDAAATPGPGVFVKA